MNGANVTSVTTETGEIYQPKPRVWIEEGRNGQTFQFTEEKRDPGSVVILDASRNLRLRLDLAGRQVLVSQSGAPFGRLAAITQVSAAPQTIEHRCPAAFQGKIAWDRKGSTTWRPENLAQLCRNATRVAPVVACFQREMQARGDWQAASNSCAEGRLQVKVLYVIPSDQTAKPGAEPVLAATMRVLQRHFFEQLGVTFELRQPLVTVVPIAEQNAQLQGQPMGARTHRLAEREFVRDYVEKDNVIVAVYEGVTTNPIVGLGSRNLLSISGSMWRPVYEAYQRDPASLHTVRLLHGWSHEMGHAFVLWHTEDARKCFLQNGLDIGTLPSLIMQQKEVLPSLFNYTFIAAEKRLLLEEDFLPACRSSMGSRPHSSLHLRHPLPR